MNRRELFGERDGHVERVAPGYCAEGLVRAHEHRYWFAASLLADQRVLDLGCGTAYGSAILAERNRHVVGADKNFAALAFGTHHDWATGSLVCCDSLSLGFKSESFDAVVSFEVIEHVSDAHALLSEARRVLRQGGLLILSTPNKSRSDESNPYHVKEYTLAELHMTLLAAGFHPERTYAQSSRLRDCIAQRFPKPAAHLSSILAKFIKPCITSKLNVSAERGIDDLRVFRIVPLVKRPLRPRPEIFIVLAKRS